MNFEFQKSIELLKRTPLVLDMLLSGISDDWIMHNEGEGTWSPYDIVGHLVFGEKTDWLVRIKIILHPTGDKLFEPFDRFAQMNNDQIKSIQELLNEFKELRNQNINELVALPIEQHLHSTGIHPEFGEVTLKQLISTWVVHDLGHLGQISRVMAKQYKEDVGPWINYLSILTK